ncbi:MAG: cryptochrome/photolyase family protein [Brevefilum sp.]|nr:cryptochrome/photolyase family protein [Brevefilum sp.]
MPLTVWILGDQLLSPHPALQSLEKQVLRQEIILLLIESREQAQRLPYHAKKLVLLYSAMRHYADGLRAAGYRVDYRVASNITEAITSHWQEFRPNRLVTMAASSVRGRRFQQSLAQKLGIATHIIPNSQFLSGVYDPLPDVEPGQLVRQEQFYRGMRRQFKLLMDDQGRPVGGTWNYDQKNRQPLPKDLTPPEMIRFEPDALTKQVMVEVGQFDHLTGSAAGFDLAVTREGAQQAADDFYTHRLPYFGTYEDAMRQSAPVIFHSKLAAYLNIGLLTPLELVRAAEGCYYDGTAEINNVEGFIRQVIGWREYMYWQYQRLMPGLGAENYWGSANPLPTFFWSGETRMNCLRQVIQRVLDAGYVHHIERLMLLSNFCLLADIHPDQVYDWFSSAFIDAYEWVMAPNVYGMGLYADGGQIATKPYIASANYINKMSDYCLACSFDKNKRTGEHSCPFNFLYWHFLLKHQDKLRKNYRMARMLHNLKFLDDDEKAAVQAQAQRFVGAMDN